MIADNTSAFITIGYIKRQTLNDTCVCRVWIHKREQFFFFKSNWADLTHSSPGLTWALELTDIEKSMPSPNWRNEIKVTIVTYDYSPALQSGTHYRFASEIIYSLRVFFLGWFIYFTSDVILLFCGRFCVCNLQQDNIISYINNRQNSSVLFSFSLSGYCVGTFLLTTNKLEEFSSSTITSGM